MIISTFELLVKPQLPKDNELPETISATAREKLGRLRRTAIQGYFLTIANLSSADIVLTLTFTATANSGSDITKDLLAFLDTTGSSMGGNIPVNLVTAPGFTNKFIANAPLMSQGTGLFLLQPNITKHELKLLNDANFEVRGFAEVTVSSPSIGNISVLITPEHRGTFFDNLTGTGSARRDQIAYSLPVQNGGLFTFNPCT